MKAFDDVAREYCAENEWSPANPKCIELQREVKKKIGGYYVDNFTEASENIKK
jgi:hypothetical protein